MKNWKVLILVLTIATFAACGGGGGNSDNEPTDDGPISVPDPSAATLVFPENNETCNEGVPLNEFNSTVTFMWNASQDTDSYTVTVRNLNTNNSSSTNSSTTSADIVIERGTPYEWFVTSRAEGTNATATSPTWRFYNEGLGIENYAPFPAEAVSPERGANLSGITSVDLSWTASDVDDDIADYEVFLDTNTDPTTSVGTATEMSLAGVAVTAGNVYYWKVVTRDSQGNSSTSETFEFRVN